MGQSEGWVQTKTKKSMSIEKLFLLRRHNSPFFLGDVVFLHGVKVEYER